MKSTNFLPVIFAVVFLSSECANSPQIKNWICGNRALLPSAFDRRQYNDEGLDHPADGISCAWHYRFSCRYSAYELSGLEASNTNDVCLTSNRSSNSDET
jgi:hypothetical protein